MGKYFSSKLFELPHRGFYIIIAVYLLVITGSTDLFAQLDRSLEAHGGLEWLSFVDLFHFFDFFASF
jgi:hypothetical protein